MGITAAATDPEGHGVLYGISTNLPDGVFFNIDENTGVVTLAHAVDSDPPVSHTQLMFEVCLILASQCGVCMWEVYGVVQHYYLSII